jgi:hypothetical protein
MLSKKPEPVPDPDEVLTGRCGTCKRDVAVSRYAARIVSRILGRASLSNPWGGGPTCACPGCGAIVYLISVRKA